MSTIPIGDFALVPFQIPNSPDGAVDPVGIVVLLVLCALVGWLVYRDAKNQDIGYAWQAGVAVAALVFAGLLPGIVALVVYFVFIRR